MDEDEFVRLSWATEPTVTFWLPDSDMAAAVVTPADATVEEPDNAEEAALLALIGDNEDD